MALNSQYMIAPSLQELFRDKSGAPLTGGFVYFYRDSSRTTLKPVYKLSGSPPDYTYVQLPNPLQLTAAGTFSDGTTNDIIPYYYPFDSNGKADLYYVVVTDSSNDPSSPVFTREAWPNFVATTDTDDITVNYIPNGQFLSHINIPASDTQIAGEIRAPITDVAYGGWTFDRPDGSSAKDIVTFQRASSYVSNPPQNPRYSIRVNCQTPNSGDAYKDLRLKFNDVNSFASSTQQYTFAFNAENNQGGTVQLQLVLIKNYGTGGDLPTENTVTLFTVDGSNSQYSVSFLFGTNDNKIMGTQDDDYIQLIIRFPVSLGFDVSLTDFILAEGIISNPSYAPTTTRQNQYRSITMPIPAYDGSQLYLVPRLTSYGVMYDDSEIGQVVTESNLSVYVNSLHPTTNKFLADGSQYETNGYSPLDIPFARIQAKYWDSTLNAPIYGTGKNYFTAIFSGTGNEIRLTNNSSGSVPNTADGTAATGFTFATIHTGSNYYVKSYLISSNIFYIEDLELGTVTNAPAAGTSGFTVTLQQAGSTLLPSVVNVTTIAATTLAGKYFTFDSIHSGVNQAWYVWFKVGGTGTDPAVASRTGIEIDLETADTADIVAQKIREALNGWQISTITTVAGSALTGGHYFTANSTNTIAYYVWYTVDGVGTDPKVLNATGIQVAVLSTDTNTQVATKTQIAINQKFFAAPDYRGWILRGWDNGAGIDPDAASRWSLVPGIIGNRIGTFESDDNKSHYHILTGFGLSGGTAGAATGATSIVNQTNPEGGYESRPRNIFVNYAIRY